MDIVDLLLWLMAAMILIVFGAGAGREALDTLKALFGRAGSPERGDRPTSRGERVAGVAARLFVTTLYVLGALMAVALILWGWE